MILMNDLKIVALIALKIVAFIHLRIKLNATKIVAMPQKLWDMP